MTDIYVQRKWLNPEHSASTGSVVAYDGPAPWRDTPDERTSFFEVADCHVKVRLHKCKEDSVVDFVQKLRTLAGAALAFADHMEDAYG